MKIPRPILFATALLLSITAHGHAQHLIDFEKYQPGPIQGQGPWKQSYGAPSLAVIVADEGPGGEMQQMVRLTSGQEGGVRIMHSLKERMILNRQVSYQLRLKQSGAGAATAFASHLNFNNGSPKFAASFGRSGRLTLFDGVNKLSATVTLSEGEWYQVDMIVAENGETITFRLWRLTDHALVFEQANLGFSEGVLDVASGYHDLRLLTTAGAGQWDVRQITVQAPENE